MSETVTLSTVVGSTITVSRCEEKLKDFCLYDAYKG